MAVAIFFFTNAPDYSSSPIKAIISHLSEFIANLFSFGQTQLNLGFFPYFGGKEISFFFWGVFILGTDMR